MEEMFVDSCNLLSKFGPIRPSVSPFIPLFEIRNDSTVRGSLHPLLKIRTKSAVRGSLHSPLKIWTDLAVRRSLHSLIRIRIDPIVRGSLHPFLIWTKSTENS